MFTICGGLVLLGLRLLSRAERVERKTGVVIDLAKAFDALPLPIPTSPEGVALAAFGATVGATLALAGKWVQKYQ